LKRIQAGRALRAPGKLPRQPNPMHAAPTAIQTSADALTKSRSPTEQKLLSKQACDKLPVSQRVPRLYSYFPSQLSVASVLRSVMRQREGA
jgi:hypothetical protein